MTDGGEPINDPAGTVAGEFDDVDIEGDAPVGELGDDRVGVPDDEGDADRLELYSEADDDDASDGEISTTAFIGEVTDAADNGFQDWHTRCEIAANDVGYLVHYCGSSANVAANNALNRANGYSQRWMAETSYSTTKRSLGDTVRALGWHHQFRKIVLMFAIINIEQLCEPL